mmetsp:Transcript_18443/g.52685  ORF Transcript_18443/g.52685 Transcript_18443/m.52685 type:complete len:216 (-) Transcript_18443:49-696(-)
MRTSLGCDCPAIFRGFADVGVKRRGQGCGAIVGIAEAWTCCAGAGAADGIAVGAAAAACLVCGCCCCCFCDDLLSLPASVLELVSVAVLEGISTSISSQANSSASSSSSSISPCATVRNRTESSSWNLTVWCDVNVDRSPSRADIMASSVTEAEEDMDADGSLPDIIDSECVEAVNAGDRCGVPADKRAAVLMVSLDACCCKVKYVCVMNGGWRM